MDAIPDAVEAIKLGDITATLALPPEEEGPIAIGNAIRLARGESLAKVHEIRGFVMTSDNAK